MSQKVPMEKLIVNGINWTSKVFLLSDEFNKIMSHCSKLSKTVDVVCKRNKFQLVSESKIVMSKNVSWFQRFRF